MARQTLKHRRIYEQHYGPIPEGFHVHHKDFNHSNDAPENLEALHPDEHAKKHGFLSNFIMAQARATDLARMRNLGSKRSEEWKQRKREQMVGNQFRTGHTHTDEWKQKKSVSMLGKKIALGSKRTPKQIDKHTTRMKGNSYALGNTFTLGPFPKVICPHCQFTGSGPGTMSRWHFDRCREKVA